MRLQSLAVLNTRRGAAETAKTEPDIAHAELCKQRGKQRDRLGVDGGVIGADRLGADLPELAVAPSLRALVAEEA